jgi:hypothetical protein
MEWMSPEVTADQDFAERLPLARGRDRIGLIAYA